MATPRQKTALAIVLGALVAIAPSFFSYLQATQEMRQKYKQGRDETEHGYETLVVAVKDLQKTALAQHDYIIKLEGQITTLVNVLGHLPAAAGLRMGSGPPLPTPERPPLRPELPAPPDFDAVQAMSDGH
jgi:hypothetical protein